MDSLVYALRGVSLSDGGDGSSARIPKVTPSAFLFPDLRVSYRPMREAQPVDSYLASVKHTILAEYAAFLRSASVERRFMLEHGGQFNPEGMLPAELRVLAAGEARALDQEELEELSNHLIVFRGAIHVTSFNARRGTLAFTAGAAWAEPLSNFIKAESATQLLDLGFVGSFINEYHACNSQVGSRSALLAAVADPHRTVSVHFRAPSAAEVRSSGQPINGRQLEVLDGLQLNVEGIQGPPGTGKSTAIFHIVNSYLPPTAVTLATAVQNKAVDAIAEKLAVCGIPFFVVGNAKRLGLVAAEWTLPNQVDRHPRVVAAAREVAAAERKVAKLKKELAELQLEETYTGRSMPLTTRVALEGDIGAAESAKVAAESAVKSEGEAVYREIVATARAVLCTVATASGSLLTNETLTPAVSAISTAILDEAGNCPETKLPLLCLLPNLQRVIAIGDQNQLPPFSHLTNGGNSSGGGGRPICNFFNSARGCTYGSACRFEHSRPSAAAAGGSASPGSPGGGRGAFTGLSDAPDGFFQRLEKALPARSIPALQDQYRMHPAIAAYISDTFYGGILRTPREVADKRLAVDAQGMYWLGYRRPAGSDGAEGSPAGRPGGGGSGSTSKVNETEAALIVDAVRTILASEKWADKSVMVTTFYKAQYHLLADRFKGAGIEEVPEGTPGRASLRLTTVDQSQGSEADIVIISGVRSNRASDIGFLKKPNRVNVAISRARELLVMVGDEGTLSTGHAMWRKLAAACKSVSSISEVPGMSSGFW